LFWALKDTKGGNKPFFLKDL
jgi:hypothetical protein